MSCEPIKDMSRCLDPKSVKYYLDNNTIMGLHPTMDICEPLLSDDLEEQNLIQYLIWGAAQVMVSERFEKNDLVDLVSAIITMYELKLRGHEIQK